MADTSVEENPQHQLLSSTNAQVTKNVGEVMEAPVAEPVKEAPVKEAPVEAPVEEPVKEAPAKVQQQQQEAEPVVAAVDCETCKAQCSSTLKQWSEAVTHTLGSLSGGMVQVFKKKMENVNLSDSQKTFFNSLSTGQKKRLVSGNVEVLWQQLIYANTHKSGGLRKLREEDWDKLFDPVDKFAMMKDEVPKLEKAIIIPGKILAADATDYNGCMIITGQERQLRIDGDGDSNGYLVGSDTLQDVGFFTSDKKLQWGNFYLSEDGESYTVKSGSIGGRRNKTRKAKKTKAKKTKAKKTKAKKTKAKKTKAKKTKAKKTTTRRRRH